MISLIITCKLLRLRLSASVGVVLTEWSKGGSDIGVTLVSVLAHPVVVEVEGSPSPGITGSPRPGIITSGDVLDATSVDKDANSCFSASI